MTIASLNPSLMSAISLLGGEAVLRVRPRVLLRPPLPPRRMTAPEMPVTPPFRWRWVC